MEIINGLLKSIEDTDIVHGRVVIPEGVTTILENAFTKDYRIKSIICPKSLKVIEKRAFKDCSNLEEIYLNDGLLEIKNSAFTDCKNLEKIEIPDSVVVIGESVFYGCESLETVILPKKIKILESYLFDRCSKLENIILPDTITEIKEYVFANCKALKSIRIPDGVTVISASLFFYCNSLTKVELPDRIEEIHDVAFAGCQSLKEINLGDRIRKIGASAFQECKSLEKIYLSNHIESIASYAFRECERLMEVKIPRFISVLERGIFSECRELTKIILPDSLSLIERQAFLWCDNLNKIEIEDSNEEIKYTYSINSRTESNVTIEVIEIYLYLYANSILKEKYQSLEEMLENKYIKSTLRSDLICYDDGIKKFQNLFYKLRKEYDITTGLLYFLNPKTTEEFSYSIWNEIKDVFSWRDNEPLEKALAEIMEVFGLFHKDKNQRKRIEKLKELLSCQGIKITEEEKRGLLQEFYFTKEEISNDFIEKEEEYYFLSIGVEIEEEFAPYLTYKISENKLKKLKKITGTYGKRLNDFIKENYKRERRKVYKLKEDAVYQDDIIEYLFVSEIEEHFNTASIHRIFDGCTNFFDEEFYQFFLDNLEFIYSNEKIQSIMGEIGKNFQSMKEYYLKQSGITDISLKHAIDYLETNSFNYQDGNYELQIEAKKAGVVDQERFNYYQELYEKNKERKMSSLVKRSNVYEIDGYTIKAELLRKDDSLSMFVGETNYTNCCQVFHGVGHNCMAHAVSSEDGGIFVTKLLKDGKWILLTESWDWQNNNVYCHDNIEGTPYLKEEDSRLRKAVAKVFQLDAEQIIEKSREEVNKYIIERRKRLEKSIHPEKEKELERLKELENREIIKLVTSGTGYDDLGLKNYFNTSISVAENRMIDGKLFTLENFQPVNYNSTKPYFDSHYLPYSDASNTQYILAGSLDDLVLERQEELEPIYRDERRIVLESNENIRNFTTKKIRDMKSLVYSKKIESLNAKIDLENSNIYIGEDWYLIYKIESDCSISISDLVRITPSLEDEKGKQLQEIISTVYNLIKTHDKVAVELSEDNTYLLYLLNKHLGYIEQVGDDIRYPLEDSSNTRVISEENQEEILRNIKKLKDSQKEKVMVHKITFKKGEKLV